jgi:hypothetical protein
MMDAALTRSPGFIDHLRELVEKTLRPAGADTISQQDLDKLTLNEQISVIGYVTDAEKGNTIITKGGSIYAITAQGWNAFSK